MRPHPPYPPNVYLKPGELYAASQPSLVETVLGSCVSVSLYCPKRHVGTICHAMLPSGNTTDYKYVDVAINHMVQVMQQNDIVISTLVAKLFGGSDMFDTARDAELAQFAVGAENIKMAHAVLKHHHIDIKKSDIGGIYGRKLLFFSETGQVFVKKLSRKTIDADLVLLQARFSKNG